VDEIDEIEKALNLVVEKLSDENYEQSLAFCRYWFGIGQMYRRISPDQIFDITWKNRRMGSMKLDLSSGKLIHPTVRLIIRFASDAESDHRLASYCAGLRSRLCARSLQEFFSNNLRIAGGDATNSLCVDFCTDVNLIAYWANPGCLEEVAIHNHILQSLISHPTLHDHQAYALTILFKLAGATFEAYVDPSVVDRCLEHLKAHSAAHPRGLARRSEVYMERVRAIQVCALCIEGGSSDQGKFQGSIQEVIALRERGWEGLPPPPVFTTGNHKSTSANQNDPTATPVVTSLGLPNRSLEPQIPQSPPLESVATSETDTVPASAISPAIQSPSVSIATFSDFTIADASDDGSPIRTLADTADDELLVDPMAMVPHETFYLEDGNVEVLCGNTLSRVTVSTLSFYSPALRQMFAQTNLATAESPNGCRRILSSDTAKDFTTLLKVVYLPEFVALLARC